MRDCIIIFGPPAEQDEAEHLRAGLDAVEAGGERAAPAAPLDAAGVQDHATGEQGAGGARAHPSSGCIPLRSVQTHLARPVRC